VQRVWRVDSIRESWDVLQEEGEEEVSKPKKLFTTSEYVKALKLNKDGNLYSCIGTEFQLFSNVDSANYDAEWLVNYYRGHGEKVRKPTIYRVKLEIVTKSVTSSPHKSKHTISRRKK